MLLSEALGWFQLSMESVKSPATLDFYKRRLPSLVEYLGDVSLDSITVNHLRAWRKFIANRSTRYKNRKQQPHKLSVYTLDQYVRASRRFFRWAFIEGYVDVNPAARLERPPLPQARRRGISRTDVNKMLSITKAANLVRDYAMISLLSTSACRVAGLSGLRLQDLDLDHRRAIVHEKGRGGNHKERTIFYSTATANAIRAYLKIRPAANDPHLFLSERRGIHGLKPAGVYQSLKRIAKLAGIEHGFNPHNFRHGCIRNWLNKGMPLSKASQLAGHSSVKVTGDIYGTSNDDELAIARDRWGDD